MPNVDRMPGKQLRLRTWPLVGFLTGFMLCPPSPEVSSVADRLIVSFGVGVVLGSIAWFIAWARNPSKPTRTALPYQPSGTARAAVFNLSMIVATVVKLFGFWGVVSALVLGLPAAVVVYGSRGQKSG